MNMSFGLATTLNTSQKLTPQMQQAIKLLQLSSLELAQEVQIKPTPSGPLTGRASLHVPCHKGVQRPLLCETAQYLSLYPSTSLRW